MFLWLPLSYAERVVLHEVARSGALSEQSCKIGTRVCVSSVRTRGDWSEEGSDQATRNVEQATACRSEVLVRRSD